MNLCSIAAMSDQRPTKKAKPGTSLKQRDLFGEVIRTGSSTDQSRLAYGSAVAVASMSAAMVEPVLPADVQNVPRTDIVHDELDADECDPDAGDVDACAAEDGTDDKKKRLAFDRTNPLFEFFELQSEGGQISHNQCTVCGPGTWKKFKARYCYEHTGVRPDGNPPVLIDAPTTKSANHKYKVADYRRKGDLGKQGV